jgi:tripartite-type tricarboxylate transporter receptor subunit TctC
LASKLEQQSWRKHHMRAWKTLALSVVALAAAAGAAPAQDYPVKPITLIVPWPAGGSTDISMRAIAEVASKHLGQPVVVDNKAGGGGRSARPPWPATASPTATPSRRSPSRYSACP